MSSPVHTGADYPVGPVKNVACRPPDGLASTPVSGFDHSHDVPARSSSSRHYAPEATRRAIIDSALRLFEAKGFHATSVQEVADEAAVTKGAFYHHFASKEDLVHLILDELLDHMLGELSPIDETVAGADERLRALLHAIVLSTVRLRSHVAVYYQERRWLDEALRRKRDSLLGQTERIVRDGIEDGTFRREVDPRLATMAINGMAAWAHQWIQDDPAGTADSLADLVLSGLERR